MARFFISEPIGIMQLSAILKLQGHCTKLISIAGNNLVKEVNRYQPDIVAYSAMTPDIELFSKKDLTLRNYIKEKRLTVFRIMGGPHATYFPEILKELNLDAICMGEGDRAFPALITQLEKKGGQSRHLSNVPNILFPGKSDTKDLIKESIANLDELSFPDRELYYQATYFYKLTGLRSFLTSRGCPYNCSYCHNHAYNKMFHEKSKVVRKRSVDNIILEIKEVIARFGPVKMIRFGDDTFTHRLDDWTIEFCEKYKKEIDIPFYCLMRSNTLTEEIAKMLAGAGCVSIGMSVETGSEDIRNKILKRNLSDKTVTRSFGIAKKYNLNTFGNTMFGIPGTTITEDYNSFIFTKRLKMTVPTFGIFCPYPGTDLTRQAEEMGMLEIECDKKFSDAKYGKISVLNSYSQEEKLQQLHLAFLAPIFCRLPDSTHIVLRWLMKMKFTWLYSVLGSIYLIWQTSLKIFPGIYPKNPLKLATLLFESVRYNISE